MKAYVYQAALWCETCAEHVKRRIAATSAGVGGGQIEDSDHWPQGPFSDGGGEADSPQHCDGCGVFLENPLTDDGAEYVKAQADFYNVADASWEEVAQRVESAGYPVLAQWIRFYFAWGQ